MTLVIAVDDGVEFKESEHPRDKKGEFAKSGAASSEGSEPDDEEDKDDEGGGGPEGHRVARPIRKVLKQAGFQKLTGNKEQIRFFHPETGVRVIIHKNPKALKSAIWSVKQSVTGPEVDKGEGHKSLADTLKKLIAEAQQGVVKPAYSPPPATTPAPEPVKPASSLPASAGSAPTEAPSPVDPPKSQEEALNQELQAAGGAEGWLKVKGYSKVGGTGKSDILKNSKTGALIQYNHDLDEWVASTPGYGAKEGKGFPNLQKLISGPTAFKAGQEKPWKASYKSIIDPTNVEMMQLEAKQAAHKQQEQSYFQTWVPAAPKPSNDEESAIENYTASGFASINKALRQNSEFGTTSKVVKGLDAYLKKAIIPEDTTIYRKVDGDYASILKSMVIKGSSFVDRGFASTSGTEATWHGSLKMVIKVKKGQRGAAVYNWSSHKGENEIILPRLSGYKVDEYDAKNNILHVTLDQSHLDEYMKEDNS